MMMRRLLLVSTVSLVLGGAIGLAQFDPAAADSAVQVAQNSPQSPPDRGGRPPHPRIDFAAAATELGVTEAELKEALGVPAEPPGEGDRPNLQSAASQLGVTEDQLRTALDASVDPATGSADCPPRPNLQSAASQLGVTEDQLRTALGVPAGGRPRLDIAGAATQLGVTEDRLVEVLGIPARPPGEQPSNGQ